MTFIWIAIGEAPKVQYEPNLARTPSLWVAINHGGGSSSTSNPTVTQSHGFGVACVFRVDGVLPTKPTLEAMFPANTKRRGSTWSLAEAVFDEAIAGPAAAYHPLLATLIP